MRLSPVQSRPAAPVVIPQEAPVYRLKAPIFAADDCLYAEGAILQTEDEPNQEMEPLNDLARQRMRDYLAKLDAYGKEVAEKTGKSYAGLVDAFEQAHTLAKKEGKRVSLIGGQEATPLMGAKKKGKKIQQLEMNAEGAPEMVTVKKKVALENTPRAVNNAEMFE